MSPVRRTTDRRRRVLYSAHADTGPSTAASRREQARLRQARSPAATYGSRVRRRLRGRWFGLVPVRRRTMAAVVAAIATMALVLCAAHYASVAWPSIAHHGDIARPLRLDRPDSFGRWFAGILMMGSAGASFLIYQLRRHRLDDFRGHYRVWRLVLIVMIFASLNSVVNLVDWTGALLDAAIGKRVALAGSDWIRIVISLGAAVLMLRLIAEIHRSKGALVALLCGAAFLAIPEAAKWNVMEVETIERWALVTSAPLLAFTSLFLALGIYLRMLYREVRRMDEHDRLIHRFDQIRLRLFQRPDRADQDKQDQDNQDQDNHDRDGANQDKRGPNRQDRSERGRDKQEREPRRRWWQRKPAQAVEQSTDDQQEASRRREKSADEKPAREKPASEQPDVRVDADPPDETETRPKRRWFGLRAAKPEVDESEEAPDADDQPVKKKRRFGLRLNPSKPKGESNSDDQSTESSEREEDSEPVTPKRRFGLGRFRRSETESDAEHESATNEHRSNQQSDDESADDEYIDPDNIDWNGLSKAERRRIRKQLKRQNRAA